MADKKYKPMLVIGILTVVIAIVGILLLEPPGSEPDAQETPTPENNQMVLRPEDVAAPEASPDAPSDDAHAAGSAPRASRSRRPRASVLAVATWQSTAPARTGAPGRSSPSPAPTRRSAAPAATAARPAATTERPAAATARPTPEPTDPPRETPVPTPAATPTEVPTPPSASVTSEPSGAEADETAAATPAEDSLSPSPVISRSGGLLPAADSKFTITMDGVREAGGMKLIEGFQATGTAVLRDIRNTLLSSSSLVKGYKDGEEIGGFEPIGTGTVLELSNRAGETVDTAVVLMPGDATGSGMLDISQLARVAAAVKGREPLSGVYFMAADVDGSGVLDEGDLMAMSFTLNRRAARRAELNT